MEDMFTSKLKSVAPALGLLSGLVTGLFTEAPGSHPLLPKAAAAQPPQAKPQSEPIKAVPGIPVKQPLGLPAVAAAKTVVIKEDAQIQGVAWSADDKLVATIVTTYEVVEARDSDGNNPQSVLLPHTTVKLRDAMTGDLKKSLGE